MNLPDLKSQFEQASRTKDLAKMNDIIIELNSADPAEQETAIEFYKEIGDELWRLTYSLSSYNLEAFEKSAKNKVSKRIDFASVGTPTFNPYSKFITFYQKNLYFVGNTKKRLLFPSAS